ncbi:hypothetical protein KSD_39810 [Ktedonobacter sp. SOSP1-85]|uniref:antibiotic biosynthesis monooxygenase family protein n=1 Tax=Ktedonobacter sp. SOSP1-85 TaxID=2778367 RepID=UPI0019164183|nr:antibiotic biosynthesis monooxygenase [Ktedonobacter sp. SOSP1-85]GHO76210.1 hypothetical protein KSD_39810 [Ktedonobacter sp. SOSP1-85]
MITEIAVFTAVVGKEEELAQGIIRGLEVIRQHPECISAHATRCIEQPGRFMVTNSWSTLEAHTVDFREGPSSPNGAVISMDSLKARPRSSTIKPFKKKR